MTNRHLATIFKGDGVNPAPYAISVKREVVIMNALEAMAEAVNHMPLNQMDTDLFAQSLIALREHLRLTQEQSRRLEHEYNQRLYSDSGLTPPKP